MKSWICSICGGGRYFGILHNCKGEPGNVIRVNMSKPCPDCGHKFKNVNDYFEHDCTEVSAPWYCTKCRTMFHTRKDYKKHNCKEREVKDIYRSQCQFCGKLVITEDAVYLGYACLDCKDRAHKFYSDVPGQSTHTVELTKQERDWIQVAFKHYPCSEEAREKFINPILAKLRPKKESVEFVEFEIDEQFKARIYSDLVVLYEKIIISEDGRGEPKYDSCFFKQIPHSTLEKLYAAYHDHKDEVKK